MSFPNKREREKKKKKNTVFLKGSQETVSE